MSFLIGLPIFLVFLIQEKLKAIKPLFIIAKLFLLKTKTNTIFILEKEFFLLLCLYFKKQTDRHLISS